MLSWFVAVTNDDETLEVKEGGTWSKLSASYRDMKAPPAIPSGYKNKYGTVPYAFPFAPQLAGLGPISDALVGRIRHRNPVFLNAVRVLFGADSAARLKLIADQREMAIQKFYESWELVIPKDNVVLSVSSALAQSTLKRSVASTISDQTYNRRRRNSQCTIPTKC